MKNKTFKPVDSKVNFPEIEEQILDFWDKNKIFEKSVSNREGKKPFVFYEGPPTANGKPGIHHVEARAFKDLIPRFKTMQGFYCERKGGWDCHGLPVEIEVEKKLGISGKPQIENYGVEKFNALCKKSVFEYVSEWERVTKRIAYWTDIKGSYETMDNSYIESGWWILKECNDKGLLYEDYKVVPYCSRCGTSLSSHELSLGYKDDVADMSVYIKFKVKDKKNTYLLAWTTTPWTLPGNVALAVDEKSDYVEIEMSDQRLILSKSRLAILDTDKYKIVAEFKGTDILGWEYEPLYSFISYEHKAHYVIPANFVSQDEGTGIVHTAVMYGEDDFLLGQKFNLPKKHVVNERGEFIPDVKPWAGMFVKKADPLIIADLEERKLLFKKEEIKHTYPYCWRCGTPLLYYAITSWYLKTTAVKNQLLANNESVNWIPAHIKEGRMGEWLRNNKDWALSRNRYWGTPLPIWKCNECSATKVVGSVAELSSLSGEDQSTLDLHRPFIDEIKWSCDKCDGTMIRVPFVLDCWFDSGAMPFAQWHYPFENKAKFASQFPADYICEAMDQTRGWFYTLQAISTLLGKGTSYKNVICLGLILDEKGNKMSKSKGNVVDPWSVIPETGADALRWYLYSVISPGESFRFSVNLVKDANRKFLLIIWNIYSFFVSYANLSIWQPKSSKTKSKNILDQWVLANLNKLVTEATKKLEAYDIYGATGLIQTFVSDLSTWYIRRSRGRMDEEFFSTCYEVLVTLCKILAPFTPFIAEEMYKNLTGKASVHLSDWPTARKVTPEDEELLNMMVHVRKTVERAHGIRKNLGIKLRQPLATLYLFEDKIDPKMVKQYEQLLREELNVKEVRYENFKKFIDSDKKLESTDTWLGDINDPLKDIPIYLDVNLTPELIAEGKARDLVREIQEARKTAGTALDEKIAVQLPDWPKEFEEYIKKETLASRLEKSETLTIVRFDKK